MADVKTEEPTPELPEKNYEYARSNDLLMTLLNLVIFMVVGSLLFLALFFKDKVENVLEFLKAGPTFDFDTGWFFMFMQSFLYLIKWGLVIPWKLFVFIALLLQLLVVGGGFLAKDLSVDIWEAIQRIGLFPRLLPRFSLGVICSVLGVVAIILIYRFVPTAPALQGASTGVFYSIMTAVTALLYYFIQKPCEDTFPFLAYGPTYDFSTAARGVEYFFQGIVHLVWSVLSMVKGSIEYVFKYLVGEWVDKLRMLSWGQMIIGAVLLFVIIMVGYFGIYQPFGDQIAEGLFRQNTMYILAGCLLGFLSIVYFAGQYFNAPGAFPRAALFVFGLLLFLFTFQITKADSTAGRSNAIVFACLVLPIIPIFVLLFRNSSWFVHILSLIMYATIAFVILVLNPGGMLDSESYDSGQVYLVTILCAFALVAVVLNMDFVQEDWGKFITKFGVAMLSFGILSFGITMVVNLFKQGQGSAPQSILLLGIIVVAAAFLIFYLFKDVKFRELISYVDYFSKFNLFLKTLSVIPCLIADLFAFFAKEWAGWILLIVELLLVVWYLFLSKPAYSAARSNPNGQELVREPVSLSKPLVLPIASYTYSYALSFWVNLKPMNTDVDHTATEFVNLVSYGAKPAVLYNASTNTIRVTMKTGKSKEVPIPGDDYRTTAMFNAAKEFIGAKPDKQLVKTEEDVDVLVADIPNVDLQKWTHFVFYYNDGKLNIFQNGDLIKTIRAAANNVSSPIMVGDEKGNRGQLCNMFFFQNKKEANDALFLGGEAITAEKIKSLYLDFKGRNPPIVDRIFKVQTS